MTPPVRTYAYGKIGDQIRFGSAKATGATWEPERALAFFTATVKPAQVIIVSKHDEIPQYLRDRGVVGYEELGIGDSHHDVHKLAVWLDGIIMWVGVNAIGRGLPSMAAKSLGQPVKPLDSDKAYTVPIVDLINAWQDIDPVGNQPHWLHPDMRYPLKTRDLRWPQTRPIHSQYDFTYNRKLYNLDGQPDGTEASKFPNVYGVTDVYEYSGLETLAAASLERVDATEPRSGAILVANKIKRSPIRDSLAGFVHSNGIATLRGGGWPEEWDVPAIPSSSMSERLRTFKVAIVPNSSGGNDRECGAATLKFWEYVAAGCIPVAAPGYDYQGHLPFPSGCRAKDFNDLDRIVQHALLVDPARVLAWQLETIDDMRERAATLCHQLVG